MIVTQGSFVSAILDPRAEVPSGLVDFAGRPASKRFNVYRNNVAVSLTEALESGFPVIRKLIGDQNFKSLAGVFLRSHPPSSPLMMHYGEALPGFLETFTPLARLPYLADIARLELALRSSYHAADAAPIDSSRLAALAPDDLVASRIGLAPAVRYLASEWPVFGIWQRNTLADAPKPEMKPEEVLIMRPGFDPEPALLPTGGVAFLSALGAGQTIGKAAETAAPTGELDLSAIFSALLSGGAILSLETS